MHPRAFTLDCQSRMRLRQTFFHPRLQKPASSGFATNYATIFMREYLEGEFMKKILAFALCLVLSFSLLACGNEETPNTENSGTSEAETEASDTTKSTEDTEPSESEETADSAAMTMEAFIASIQGQMDQMAAGLESMGMNLDVVARGNSLAYVYQYTIDVGDTSLVKDSLERSLDSMSDTFTSILDSLKLTVPDAESVIVEYLDMNGNVILSKEFK